MDFIVREFLLKHSNLSEGYYYNALNDIAKRNTHLDEEIQTF
jgi:hypothetical protein